MGGEGEISIKGDPEDLGSLVQRNGGTIQKDLGMIFGLVWIRGEEDDT